eukprot:538301-Prorocentrum_minimum.AAC.1
MCRRLDAVRRALARFVAPNLELHHILHLREPITALFLSGTRTSTQARSRIAFDARWDHAGHVRSCEKNSDKQ